jgi:uncharacterized DUF497 family protein
MKFEWDEDKNLANLKKHKISFEDAAFVFSDKEALTIYDNEHSADEDRWITIGMIKNTNLIVVIHTERIRKDIDFISIISARKANKNEINEYINQLSVKL